MHMYKILILSNIQGRVSRGNFFQRMGSVFTTPPGLSLERMNRKYQHKSAKLATSRMIFETMEQASASPPSLQLQLQLYAVLRCGLEVRLYMWS